jgi:hypothetical protein
MSMVAHQSLDGRQWPAPSAAPPTRPVRAPAAPSLAAGQVALRAALIVALLLVNTLGTVGSVIFFVVLAAMIIRSSEAAFLALVLSGVGLLSNMRLVPKTSVWTVCRIAILFVCAARFSFDLASLGQTLFSRAYYWALLVFVAAAAVCSVLSGYYTQIALLKLLSFSVGMTAVLSGVLVLQARRADVTPWFVAIAGALVFNGFLSLAIGAGYGRSIMGDLRATSTFFQGPFYHPNACGPFCAMLILLLFCTWLFSRYRHRLVCLALIPPLLWFMWLSRSRTGFASLLVGTLVAVGVMYLPAARRLIRLRLNYSRAGILAWMIALGLGLVLVDFASRGKITATALSFVNKYNATSTTLDTSSIFASREALIAKSWETFLERPLTGIGFEVSLDRYFVENATLFSAPIEKGFLPTAILEEVGIVGTVPFVVFLLLLIRVLWQRRSAAGLTMLLTYLITNLGEVTVFAFGGPALFGWLLVAAGFLLGDQCLVALGPPRSLDRIPA